MPLTRPMPDAALPVLAVIRERVKKPAKLPNPCYVDSGNLRWTHSKGFCCAMGLVPEASDTPGYSTEFDNLATTEEVTAFGSWFDEQIDPQAVVDFIWGEK